MRKTRAAFILAATGAAWLGCSKDSTAPTPTLAGQWTVVLNTPDQGSFSPNVFPVNLWASAGSYVVGMPTMLWSVGPTVYNSQGTMIQFGPGGDTLAGFSIAFVGQRCHSIQIFGSVNPGRDTLRNAVAKIYDTDSSNVCVSHHGATATVVKTGSAGAMPAATHLTADGTWHVSVGLMQNYNTLVPDTFTAVLGAGTGTISASFPALTFNNGTAFVYDTFATGVRYVTDTLWFERTLQGMSDAQSCRGVSFYGIINARPGLMIGAVFVTDSGMAGCSLTSIGSFEATKGP